MFHKPIRFLPDVLKLDYMRLRFVGLVVSVVLVLASIGYTAIMGLNFGIDFKGGIMMELRFNPPRAIDTIRPQVEQLGLGQVTLQESGAQGDVLIRIQQQPDGEVGNQRAISAVKTLFGTDGVEYRRNEMVGPQVGGELIRTSLWAVLLSIGGIMAYIWFRFDWPYAVSTIICLVHDIILTIGFFAITRIDFDLTTVAAILLISGYSLNDTVVVFDRVRENLRKYRKMPIIDLVNLSLNETLYRTLMTSGTTFMVLLSLYIFGGAVISGFTIALLFGIAIGTYSSIWVAAPFLLVFNPRREEQTAMAPV